MTGPELAAFARMVRRTFAKNARRGGFRDVGDDTVCDLDDVEQNVALEVWKRYMELKFDDKAAARSLRGIELEGNRSMYFAIGARAASMALKRARSNVALTDHAIKQLGMDGKGESRVLVRGCSAHDESAAELAEEGGLVDLAVAPTTPAAIASRDATRARLEVLRAVRDVVGEDDFASKLGRRHYRRAVRRSDAAVDAFRTYVAVTEDAA